MPVFLPANQRSNERFLQHVFSQLQIVDLAYQNGKHRTPLAFDELFDYRRSNRLLRRFGGTVGVISQYS